MSEIAVMTSLDHTEARHIQQCIASMAKFGSKRNMAKYGFKNKCSRKRDMQNIGSEKNVLAGEIVKCITTIHNLAGKKRRKL